jgi:hypothetical protein
MGRKTNKIQRLYTKPVAKRTIQVILDKSGDAGSFLKWLPIRLELSETAIWSGKRGGRSPTVKPYWSAQKSLPGGSPDSPRAMSLQ